MFWKFGFHDTSTLDTLLNKSEISLEAILEEEDLLQECKSHNTRLIDYFQRVDVLQRLFGYVSGTIEGEGAGKFKYPYVATEVLCSDIWSIVETCLSKSDQLLTPFWDTILDRTPEDMKTQNVMASHFSKINAMFLLKKPHEMLAFIQAQPRVVERILMQIETPAIVDLLVRIIQIDEYTSGANVLEWLSRERLIPRLVDLLSPSHSVSMHAVVSELVKGIISMAAPSPGAGITDGMQNGPASNLFARQLAKRENIEKLVGFMLDDFSFEEEKIDAKKELTNGTSTNAEFKFPPIIVSETSQITPNLETATSSGTQSISIIIELIRKNNSDYFEPYLFHTIRNRLIQIQQHLHVQSDEGREALEQAFVEMTNRMGVVHLGPLLEIMCDRLEKFQQLLHKPRSAKETIPTTIGPLMPLTFERFRICELYAELLHCSNMSLLNRPVEFDRLYDEEGRLRGGLSSLEELASVIELSRNNDSTEMEDDTDELEPAQELPISIASADLSVLDYSDEDEDMSGDDGRSNSSEDEMEEIDMNEDVTPPPVSPRVEPTGESSALFAPSSPNTDSAEPASPRTQSSRGVALSRTHRLSASLTESDRSSIVSRPASAGSRRSLKRSLMIDNPTHLPIGDKMKQRFSETGILSTLLDLFFDFPWNNFLHSVVYDVLHQILTGKVDYGLNKELTVSLFRDARLLYRIVEAQKRNDEDSSKPKHVRLGYMGHLTLISEDVITALQHYPPDLKLRLAKYAPQPDWDDYIGGRYQETKVKDTSLLGGGKPMLNAGVVRSAAKWKVDEAEITPALTSGSSDPGGPDGGTEMNGEFRRTGKLTRESSADFGVAPMSNEEPSGPPQFASYLAQAMSTHITSSDDGSDEEDEDGGWLAQKFSEPPISSRNMSSTDRRPLDPGGFDEAFTPRTLGSSSVSSNGFDDNFTFDDDAFGPFSDAAAVRTGERDPFGSITNITEDVDETSFDSFGDFGDFQTADGELTPTGGSWSFASDTSISSESDDAEVIDTDRFFDASSGSNSTSSSPHEIRTDTTK